MLIIRAKFWPIHGASAPALPKCRTLRELTKDKALNNKLEVQLNWPGRLGPGLIKLFIITSIYLLITHPPTLEIFFLEALSALLENNHIGWCKVWCDQNASAPWTHRDAQCVIPPSQILSCVDTWEGVWTFRNQNICETITIISSIFGSNQCGLVTTLFA